MSKKDWNNQYITPEYIYGTEPNECLRTFLADKNHGRILFPAEGEGRNLVYAASLGWHVDAFDQSEAGRDKAMQLSKLKGVEINYSISSLEERVGIFWLFQVFDSGMPEY
jgi:hypothetical protein